MCSSQPVKYSRPGVRSSSVLECFRVRFKQTNKKAQPKIEKKKNHHSKTISAICVASINKMEQLGSLCLKIIVKRPGLFYGRDFLVRINFKLQFLTSNVKKKNFQCF